MSDDNRVRAVRTGLPEVQLLACVLCGVLLWDIASHYKHSHGSCGHPNHGAQDHDCAPFLPDPEPGADTGCPHKTCEIDTAGNHTRCADCGDLLAAAPDREPSDAAVEAAARAMAHADVTNPDGWVMTEEARNVYSDMARAALIAAQEVSRNGDR